MKLVYSNENGFLVNNAKNLVENAGIAVALKNEYVAGGAGELSPLDTWLELWVVNDADHERAQQIIQDAVNKQQGHDWFCAQCHEKNASSFEICWHCQTEKPVK
jgi:hypothetical protein